jgi:cell division transport system ATP-binding protein
VSTLTARNKASRGSDRRNVIVLEDVSKHYPNGTRALQDVSLSIPEGDFVFLVGASGAGKSTIIRLLTRAEAPTAGRIEVDGEDVGRLPRSHVPHLRRKLGVVFQDFKLLPAKTVYENVAFALQVTGHPDDEVRERTDMTLELVGLAKRRDHYPDQLSGGEQQRTAIARALVGKPPVVVADEPTGNLDPVTSWEIIQLLSRINELGTTLVMATHNQEIVNAMRKRVVALEHGSIVRDQAQGAYQHA